jgi:hypothetical protein
MENLQAPAVCATVYRFDTSQSSRPLICFPKTIVVFFSTKKIRKFLGISISSLNQSSLFFSFFNLLMESGW